MSNWRIKHYYNDEGIEKFDVQELRTFWTVTWWKSLATFATEKDCCFFIEDTITFRRLQEVKILESNRVIRYIPIEIKELDDEHK
jgi:hypothetical protein